jgi:plastocyanin
VRRLLVLLLVAALGAPLAVPAGDAAAAVPLKKLCKKKPSKLTKKQRKRCRKWRASQAGRPDRVAPDPAPQPEPEPKPDPPVVVPPEDPGDVVPPPAPAATWVGVRAEEFKLTLSRTSLSAGDAIVELQNFGEDPHDLRIAPAGAPLLASFPEIDPGTRHKERITFAAGSYKLFCSLPGHESLGMRATLTVATASP